VDLVGPLPQNKCGYKYLLTYVCVAIRWPEAVPLQSIRARAVMDALVDIFASNGIPRILIMEHSSLGR